MKLKLLSALFLLGVWACHPVKLAVTAAIETTPVSSTDDAADDPAIYIHPTNPEQSVVIGTDKQMGLEVYSFTGKTLNSYAFGRINNVDLRTQFRLPNGKTIVLVGGSNRTNNSISLFRLDPETAELQAINAEPIISKVGEIYGFCLYQKDKTYAFAVGKDGRVEQWELSGTMEGKITGTLVRFFSVGGQCEGMVADDELGDLYIAEEERGIWKYDANPKAEADRIKIQLLSENNQIKGDLEGLTIYYGPNGTGYLIASSQGNNSYAIYERQGNNRYIGSFRITKNLRIDGTSDTDGIDVTNLVVNETFKNGVFIVQDGNNRENKTKLNQNFKLVPWEQIAKAFSPPLNIDNQYKIKH